MITASELTEWSDGIWRILVDINIAMTNLRIIKVERENKLHSINQGFFRMLELQQRFIVIVQLAKIFSDKKGQHRNIIKICNKLEFEPYDDEMIQMLSENCKKLTDVFRTRDDVISAVKEFRTHIDAKNDSLERVFYLRDKVYAHSDKDAQRQSIEHAELEELNTLAQEMYNTLYGKIFDRYFYFRSDDWDLRWVIRQLKSIEERKNQFNLGSATDSKGSA